jgi:flagellar protein FliS
MFARPSAAAAYAKVGVESHVSNADPHQLILMLFDGALLAINTSAIAMERGDIDSRVKNISKAIEIITLGLKASLDAQAGGELAERLGALYDYMCSRLLHANAFSTDAPLTEVSSLLRDLRDAWTQIANAGKSEHLAQQEA